MAYADLVKAVSPNLYAYYRLADLTGTQATDASGSARHGVYSNAGLGAASLLTNDGTGRSILLNGTTGHVVLPSGLFGTLPSGLTITAWVYPTAATSWARIVELGTGAASNNIILARNGVSNDLAVSIWAGGVQGPTLSAAGALPLNTVSFVAVTITAAGAAVLYRNGVQVASGSVTAPGNVARTQNYIGRSNWATDGYWAGRVDEVAIYDRVLTAQNMADLYTMGTSNVPLAPTAPVLSNVNASSITLTWTDRSTDETALRVERQAGGGPFTQVGPDLPAGTTTYQDTTVSPGVTYGYQVRGVNSYGAGAPSAVTSATTPAASVAPVAPSGLTATAVATTRVDLAWADNSNNEAAFVIQRRVGAGAFADYATLGPNVTSYQDTGVVANTLYGYQVRAQNAAGQSAYTAIASATTPASAPTAPGAVIADVAPNGLSVLLSWSDPTGETSIVVMRGTGPAGAITDLATLAADSTAYQDGSISAATTYRYQVRAVNASGASLSSIVSVTTPAAPPAPTGVQDVIVYGGPGRGVLPLPKADASGDWTPVSPWTDLSAVVRGGALEWADGHELQLTLTLDDWSFRSLLFPDDRQIIVRARWEDPTTGVVSPYQVVFAGYVVGPLDGSTSSGEGGPEYTGTVVCRQDWTYWAKQQVGAVSFGLVNLAQGKGATASSTLANAAAEAPLEYLSAPSVAPANVTDGRRDTCWVSNGVATVKPPLPITTGPSVLITKLATGRSLGLARWIELSVAAVAWYDTLPNAGTLGSYEAITGVLSYLSSDSASADGSGCLRAQGPGGGSPVGGTGWSTRPGGMAPNVECGVSLWLKAQGSGACYVNILVGGGAGEGGRDVYRVRVRSDQWTRYAWRRMVKANGAVTLSLRYDTGDPGITAILADEIRVSGGVRFSEGDQPYRYTTLVFDDGFGNQFSDQLVSLGITALAGDQALILTDDKDLFTQQYSVQNATVVQWRDSPALAQIDFVSGRGRFRVAFWRRWVDGSGVYPDLPGGDHNQLGQIWDDINLASLPAFSATQALVRSSASRTAFTATSNPAPGGAPTTATEWVEIDLGAYVPVTVNASAGTTVPIAIATSSTADYPDQGWFYWETERVYATKQGASGFLITQRPSPVAHAAGVGFSPEQNGARVTLPLVAAVGIRRRPGTPVLVDFDLIGTTLASPGDPAPSNQWGSHPDWQTLVRVRGNRAGDVTYLLGQREQDAIGIPWPPPAGTTYAFGKQLRKIRLVVMQMQPWDGAAQRAKVNELVVYEASLQSSQGSGWSGTRPPDLRGIALHFLTQFGGITPDRVDLQRGAADNIPWGAHYGSMKTAPGAIGRLIQNLETAGQMRVAMLPDGRVRVQPDPLTTSAAFAPALITWSAANASKISASRAGAHPVAQVRVNALNADTGERFTSEYPRSPNPYGDVLDISDVFVGNQEDCDTYAVRAFRQRSATWTFTVDTFLGGAFVPYARHIVNCPEADADGLALLGRNAMVTGYKASWAVTDTGIDWRSTYSLTDLQPWG